MHLPLSFTPMCMWIVSLGSAHLLAAVLEVWDRSRCLSELHVPKSLHGGVFNDGWFGTGASAAG